MKNYLIATKRLVIAPFDEKHLTSKYVNWLNDFEVVRYSEQRHKVHTLQSCYEYWQSFYNTPHCLWAVEEQKLGHIGNINAYIDINNSTADVGILIGERSAWGCGYGLEAWSAVCDYLLNQCGLRKITAGTLAVNQSMIRVMQKSGMLEDGQRKRQYLIDGQEVDVVYYAMFKNSLGEDNEEK